MKFKTYIIIYYNNIFGEKIMTEIAKGALKDIDRYKTMVDSGQSTLKALLIMNGGATVTLLTFITHLTSKTETSLTSPLIFIYAICLFIVSTFLTVLSYGAIFATNCYSYKESNDKDSPKRKWWFNFTIIFVISSLVVFAVACVVALIALIANTTSIFGIDKSVMSGTNLQFNYFW
jgi:hypothetical protein